MNVVKAKGLSINYGNIQAVENASFEIKKGSFTAIVGSNGSGKSSILRALMGLESYMGRVDINMDKSEIAYLPQTSFAVKDFPATVYEVVLSGRQTKKNGIPFYSKEDKKLVETVLSEFDITEIKNKQIGELSGGQRQRAFLARAMVKSPQMLLLDEPCAGLDSEITEKLYQILYDLNRKNHITIIMVSHDLDEIEKYASDVIVVSKTISFCGTINDWLLKKHKDCK